MTHFPCGRLSWCVFRPQNLKLDADSPEQWTASQCHIDAALAHLKASVVSSSEVDSEGDLVERLAAALALPTSLCGEEEQDDDDDAALTSQAMQVRNLSLSLDQNRL